MNEANLQKLALIITASCLKDSVIEQCHQQQKFSESEWSALNKQLSDRMYTFLTYLITKPTHEYVAMMETLVKNFPTTWDAPTIDPSLISQTQQQG